jgi:hypothetical protein
VAPRTKTKISRGFGMSCITSVLGESCSASSIARRAVSSFAWSGSKTDRLPAKTFSTK